MSGIGVGGRQGEDEAPVADLVIVGAGAKAAAIAAKVDAINGLGLAELTVTIVEKAEPAASWLGLNGMTSGEEPLAVPPIKDVGFPYRSARQFPEVGDELDAALLPLSWQRHSIERGEYAPWVNSGAPPILHREYGTYLGWVLERATEGVSVLSGRVVAIELDPSREQWVIEVEDQAGAAEAPALMDDKPRGETRRLRGRALLLTGPGVHRAFPHDPAAEPRVLHCDSRRGEFARLPADREVDVAIVGGGESALSALVFLRAMRPQAKITVYTPMLPLSRGESFLENRVFADPDDVGWEHLDLETRRDFVKHCDRGVFDAGVIARLAGEQRCAFELGRAVQVNAARGGEEVELELDTAAGPAIAHHEYVVNCTGFDLLAQLRGLFAEPVRAGLEERVGPIWDRPPGTELRFDRSLALEGLEPRLHIPGLAGLGQGPGFANLGSLGLLANRVLAPLVPALTRAKRGAAAAALTILVVALLAGCGGGSSSSSTAPSAGAAEAKTTAAGAGNEGGDPGGATAAVGYPGIDLANSRFVGGPIDRSSAAGLKLAWTLPSEAQSTYGAYSASPVVVDGVVYMQDLESNVQAVDLESGELLWETKMESPDQGPNGVAVAEGMVFGATATNAFALDAETGEEVWSTELITVPKEAIDMSPGVHDGLVYVSTVPTDVTSAYNGGIAGVLWALDTKTGAKRWSFDTAPKGLWSKNHKTINAGGGLWYAPSFDEEGGMYIGTGNPVPFPGAEGLPWGKSRPGPNHYTDSLVKLNAKTGKLEWFFQATPHDVYDWDFQDPPILADVGGRELAIGAGKSGIVAAVDAKTGKPVWKVPVGKHNGHDEDGLLAMRGEFSKLPKQATVYPGLLGGVIAPMAASKTTLFVPVVNHPLTVENGEVIGEGEEMSGEMVALDLATGKQKWSQTYEGPAFGAPVAVNDMVFFSTFEGTLHGLDAGTGGEVWSASLPAGANSGVIASGDSLVLAAGIAVAEGQVPSLVAYRLGG
ncbi:MAG: PQQ-binding-like beta-propeller repeat protein [Actinobacteria bacterium]|nr:PQQ-binding-like beta-propeller repeat protein [Actinomycetota bacterium]